MSMLWLLLGYLAGSVSGARIAGRGIDFGTTRVVVGGTGEFATVDGVSPSMLRAREGNRAGIRAGMIDIAKALLIAGAGLTFDGSSAAAWATLGSVIGHVYPAYHRFRGGFGISPLIGGLLVVDPVGLLVSLAVGIAVGVALGSAFAMTELWPMWLAPWMIWQDRHVSLVVVAFAASLLYFWRSRDEMRVALSAWRGDRRSRGERIAEVKTYPAYLPGS